MNATRKIITVLVCLLSFCNTLSIYSTADTFEITGDFTVLLAGETANASMLVNASATNETWKFNNYTWDQFINDTYYGQTGKRLIPVQLPSVFQLNTTEATLTSTALFHTDDFASGTQRLVMRLPIEYDNITECRLSLYKIYNPAFLNLTTTYPQVSDANYPQMAFNYSIHDGGENVTFFQNYTIPGINASYEYNFCYVELNCPIYTDQYYAPVLYVKSSANIKIYASPTDVSDDQLLRTVILDHNTTQYNIVGIDLFSEFMGVFGMADGSGGIILDENAYLNFTIPDLAISPSDYITFVLPLTDQVGGVDSAAIDVTITDGSWSKTIGDERNNATFVNTTSGLHTETNTCIFDYRPNQTQYDATGRFQVNVTGANSTFHVKLDVKFTDATSLILNDTWFNITGAGSYWIDGFKNRDIHRAGTSGSPYGGAYSSKTINFFRMSILQTGGSNLDVPAYSGPTNQWENGSHCIVMEKTYGIPVFGILHRADKSGTNFVFYSGQYDGSGTSSMDVIIHMKNKNTSIWLYDYVHSNVFSNIDANNSRLVYESGGNRKTFWFRPWCSLIETAGIWTNDYVPPIIEYEYFYIIRYLNITTEELSGWDWVLTGAALFIDGVSWSPDLLIDGAKALAKLIWHKIKDTAAGDVLRVIGDTLDAVWDKLTMIGNALLSFGAWMWDALSGIASFVWNSGIKIYEFIRDNVPVIVSALVIISRLVLVLVCFMAVMIVRSAFLKLCIFFNLLSTRGLKSALEYGATMRVGFGVSTALGGLREFGGKIAKAGEVRNR